MQILDLWMQMPKDCNFHCECGSNDVKYRHPSAEDSFVISQCKCNSCKKEWWADLSKVG